MTEPLLEVRQVVKRFGAVVATAALDLAILPGELGVRALVCFGYPFHPPGKPEKLRTEHLAALQTPALIIQGERDPFGTPADVASYELSPSIEIAWLAGGDHSYKPRERENIAKAIDLAAGFIEHH